MEVRRIFVSLSVVVATLACCLLHLPLGVHMLPANPRILTRLKTRELPPYDAHKKNRYSRETSESVLTMATTPQLPLPSESAESSEGSGAVESQGVRCANRMQRNSRCKTLKDKLVEYFDRFGGQLPPLDSFYNSFVLEDINFFGLLGRTYTFTESQRTRNHGSNTCAAILEHYHRPRTIRAGNCHWNYSCSYDPNRFPRFVINATLLEPQQYIRQRCEEVTMSRVTYFQREECLGDPCERENWTEHVMPNIVVGYVEQEDSR